MKEKFNRLKTEDTKEKKEKKKRLTKMKGKKEKITIRQRLINLVIKNK